jgi:hypothetical protein
LYPTHPPPHPPALRLLPPSPTRHPLSGSAGPAGLPPSLEHFVNPNCFYGCIRYCTKRVCCSSISQSKRRMLERGGAQGWQSRLLAIAAVSVFTTHAAGQVRGEPFAVFQCVQGSRPTLVDVTSWMKIQSNGTGVASPLQLWGCTVHPTSDTASRSVQQNKLLAANLRTLLRRGSPAATCTVVSWSTSIQEPRRR